MCIRDRLLLPGLNKDELQQATNAKNITIISNHYLKDIRTELLEENEKSLNNNNNEILYITAEVEGIPAKIMTDTGANISIINANELERIQKGCGLSLIHI